MNQKTEVQTGTQEKKTKLQTTEIQVEAANVVRAEHTQTFSVLHRAGQFINAVSYRDMRYHDIFWMSLYQVLSFPG